MEKIASNSPYFKWEKKLKSPWGILIEFHFSLWPNLTKAMVQAKFICGFIHFSVWWCGDYCNLTVLWYVLSPIQVLRPTIVWEAILCCNVSRKSMHEIHFTHPTNLHAFVVNDTTLNQKNSITTFIHLSNYMCDRFHTYVCNTIQLYWRFYPKS